MFDGMLIRVTRRIMLAVGVSYCVYPYHVNAQDSFFSLLFNAPTIHKHVDRFPVSFADLADRLLPSVVNISATSNVKIDSGTDADEGDDNNDDLSNNNYSDPDSPFEKFFRDYMNRKDGGDSGTQSLGSGFIVDASGLIVTNYHVIKDAEHITVTLQNNRVLAASLIGIDERTDLALLKVKANYPLPATHFGDSDKSRVGDWVLAIGNPYGLSGTVTSGIISSRGRDIEQGPYDDFIQTDAPINKGNSGGPLFNMDGEVVGINTAIFSPSGGSIGIAFAIPSNEARGIIEQLSKTGKVARGWAGVRIQEITENIADSLNTQPFQGALVAQVDPKGPAAKAGLKPGDVIESLNGNMVTAHTMPRMIAQMSAGTKVELNVLRQGKKMNLPLIVGNLVEDNNPPPPVTSKETLHNIVKINDLNISVSNIDDILRQKYNLAEKQYGIVVISLNGDKKQHTSELKAGDVIIGTQIHNISNVKDLQSVLKDFKNTPQFKKRHNGTILFLVQTGDNMHWVPMLITEK